MHRVLATWKELILAILDPRNILAVDSLAAQTAIHESYPSAAIGNEHLIDEVLTG